jgi:hypothetical protein
MRISLLLVLAMILIPALGLAGVGQAQAQPLQVSPVPIWGVVLGTIIVAGLLYLLVHGPDGAYYRYPYYGQYYGYYYHSSYRPYTGYYAASAPVITVAPLIVGTVLGIVTLNNVQYILSRDAGGHLYRYPYYGPYRQFYYRPAYRPYQGAFVRNGDYRSAPVRQGDPRWDTDRRILAPANQRPQPHPTYQQPQRQPNRTYQRSPQQPHPTYQQPQRQPNRTYQRPQQQRSRTYQQRPQQSNPGQNPGRGNSGGSRNPQQRCGQPQEPPCSNNNSHP